MTEDTIDQHARQLPAEQPYWLICGVVTCGVMLSTLTASIVNVAMPTMVVALHTDLPTAQWISTGYYLMIICLLPLIGRAGDFWGPFRVFSAGFLVVLAGSFLCNIAPSV
jgi:MFS family permease